VNKGTASQHRNPQLTQDLRDPQRQFAADTRKM